jgi:hypothetical protein
MRWYVLAVVALECAGVASCSHVRYVQKKAEMQAIPRDPANVAVLKVKEDGERLAYLRPDQDKGVVGIGFTQLLEMAQRLGGSHEDAVAALKELDYPLSVQFDRLDSSAIRWSCQNTPAPTIEPDGSEQCPWGTPYKLAVSGQIQGVLFDGKSLAVDGDSREIERGVLSGKGEDIEARRRIVLREWSRPCLRAQGYSRTPLIYESKTKLEYLDLAVVIPAGNVQEVRYSVTEQREPLGSGWWIAGAIVTGVGAAATYGAVKSGFNPILYGSLPVLGVGVLLDLLAIVDSNVPVERTRTGTWVGGGKVE